MGDILQQGSEPEQRLTPWGSIVTEGHPDYENAVPHKPDSGIEIDDSDSDDEAALPKTDGSDKGKVISIGREARRAAGLDVELGEAA